MFYSHPRNLSQMWFWLAQLSLLHSNISLPTAGGSLGRAIMARQLVHNPLHLALYLRHLMSEAKTASPIESAVHSIAWMHQLGGERSPTDHPLVKSFLSGAQRLLAHRTSKKEPITVSQLKQLVACKADAMASLYYIRSVVICDIFWCIS